MLWKMIENSRRRWRPWNHIHRHDSFTTNGPTTASSKECLFKCFTLFLMDGMFTLCWLTVTHTYFIFKYRLISRISLFNRNIERTEQFTGRLFNPVCIQPWWKDDLFMIQDHAALFWHHHPEMVTGKQTPSFALPKLSKKLQDWFSLAVCLNYKWI